MILTNYVKHSWFMSSWRWLHYVTDMNYMPSDITQAIVFLCNEWYTDFCFSCIISKRAVFSVFSSRLFVFYGVY